MTGFGCAKDMPHLPGDLRRGLKRVETHTAVQMRIMWKTPITMHHNIMYIRPQILQSAIPHLFSGMKTSRSWLQQAKARGQVRFEFDAAFCRLEHANRFCRRDKGKTADRLWKGKVKPYRAVFARIGRALMPAGSAFQTVHFSRGDADNLHHFYRHRETGLCLHRHCLDDCKN